jgi:hypothetical protein
MPRHGTVLIRPVRGIPSGLRHDIDRACCGRASRKGGCCGRSHRSIWLPAGCPSAEAIVGR